MVDKLKEYLNRAEFEAKADNNLLCQEDPMTPKEEWIQLNSSESKLCVKDSSTEPEGQWAEAIRVTTAGIPKLYCNLTQVKNEGLPTLSQKGLRKVQAEDPICCLTLKALKSGWPELLLAADSPKDA